VPKTAVLAHGSGSSADFVRRVFAPALAECGIDLVAVEERSGDVHRVAATLAAAADTHAADLVGGVSLGAHAAVLVAAARVRLSGVLLVLPAWTGPPGEVAALSAAAADEVEREGMAAVLARVRTQGWVGAELAAAWPDYGDDLVGTLRATATSPGPTTQQLRAVRAPAGLVALDPDPFHPADVARAWRRLLPSAALEVLPDDAPAADRAILGRAAVRAWQRARASRLSGSR